MSGKFAVPPLLLRVPHRRLERLMRQVLLTPAACASSSEAGASVTATAPMAGIRVIDCSSVVAGPTACALLADMGADVIKIEPPDAPDITRRWGNGDDPALTAMPDLQSVGQGGSAFAQCNRGKRSICLDITNPAGMGVLRRMMATADVFVTNIRIQSLRKVGLDYEALQESFPRLIYAHFSAYGRSGPLAEDPGYDFAAWWAQTGVMDLTRAGEKADMPRFPGAIGDNSTAVQLAGFIGTALFHRERTGRGQLVDAALFRSGIFALSHPLTMYAGGNGWGRGGVRETTKLGERSTLLTDANFLCKCGTWIQLFAIDHGKHMKKVLSALGLKREDLTPGAKSWEDVNWSAATRIADKVFASKTFDEWHSLFVERDVWHAKVNRFEDMWENPQALSSNIFVEAPGVNHKLTGNPIGLSAAKMGPCGPAPAFGQHTGEVLRECGIAADEEARLRKEGIVK